MGAAFLLRRGARAAAIVPAVAVLLAACGDGSDQADQQRPPPEVIVETVEPKSLPLTLEYPGRVAGYRQVEVRARVEGILLSREYEEGEIVQQGDVLFRIDPREYAAGAESAKARLAEAEANLRNAQQRWERVSALFSRGTASAATRDDARAARDLARAALNEAKANAETAGLSLDYTTVEAPITGATSTETRSEGSLVGSATDTEPLTTITQLDPVYVNFSPAETEVTRIRREVAAGRLDAPLDGKYAARIISGDGSPVEQTGIVDFTDNTVDLDTGTIRARAVFDNPDNRLIPGQFVRVQITGLTLVDAITVPRKALNQAPEGAYVYVVEDDGTAIRRQVEIGDALKERWVILSGLEAGERVVTEGVVKVQDGQKVAAVTASGEPSQTAANEDDAVPAQGSAQ